MAQEHNKEPETAQEWCYQIIEGSGGMNQFEDRELVIWNVPDLVAAAEWTLRCLANPQCAGSATVLDEIMARRRRLQEEAKEKVENGTL